MEKDNENIAKEQAQRNTVRAATGGDSGGSLGETRAFQPGRHQGHTFTTQPPAPPPSGGGMPRHSPNSSPQAYAPLFQTASSSSGPPPPPSMGPKVAAGRSASQVPVPKQFDMGINDGMNEAQAETERVFEQMSRDVLERKKSIGEQIAQNLGPHSATADQSYVARLTADGNKSRGRYRMGAGKKDPMDLTTNPQQ